MDTDRAQKLHPSAVPGSIVRTRGAAWRVVDVTPGDRCRAVRLQPLEAGSPAANAERVLLDPFDRFIALPPRRRARRVSRRAWVSALGALAAAARLADVPASAASARIDLRPYQLEPAIGLLRGDAARVLLADPVGLGKTVQAGVILSELLRRGQADRVLIVVPAGLRDQWRGELRARFDLEVTWCDSSWLATQTARLPAGLNPWLPPAVRLVSMDFVKRLETLNGIDDLAWDLLIVDEAHAASAGSDRGLAVNALARRSRHVVLATATPHDGNAAAFESLCGIGRLDPSDDLVLFRRPRGQMRPAATRRITLLRVRRSADEQRMDALLADYAHAALEGGAAPAARLALSVLLKRSWSSARALELTASRRRLLLSEAPAAPEPLRLPFDVPASDEAGRDDEVSDEVLAAPALRNIRHEIARLGAIAEAARRAARSESKIHALARLLRRTPEPVIVFTEYRDTLAILLRALGGEDTPLLHGGQAADDRRQALAAFAGGRARVLLATDAASQGLNLHTRCRRVVLLELPWTPTRVEQRVGRVDRFGQHRPVHATCLIAAATREETVLGRHAARLAEIRRRLGAADEDPRSTSVVDHFVHAHWRTVDQAPCPHEPTGASAGFLHGPSQPTASAIDAAQWLERLRQLLGRRPSRGRARRGGWCFPREGDGPLVTTLRLRRALAHVTDGVLLVVRVALGEVDRPPLDVHVVPVVCRPVGTVRRTRDAAAAVRDLLEHAWPTVEARVAESFAGRAEQVLEMAQRARRRDLGRRAAIRVEQSRSAAAGLLQPGLFDRTPNRTPATDPLRGDTRDGPEPAFRFRAQVVLAAVFHVR